MSAAEFATFTKLATKDALSTHLSSFCASANLLCFPDIMSQSLEKHQHDINFVAYGQKNFSNYGSNRRRGDDSFDNYSDSGNTAENSFMKYSRGSTKHSAKFSNYAPAANSAQATFNNHGRDATSGTGDFRNYSNRANVPFDQFASYSNNAKGRLQSFNTYIDSINLGADAFTKCGENADGAANDFTKCANNSNIWRSDFSNYGEAGHNGNDTFTTYNATFGTPQDSFKNFGRGGNGSVDIFKNYIPGWDVDDTSFKSYSKNSNAAKINFVNYGQPYNDTTREFTSYGIGANGQTVGFKECYEFNNSFFKDYAKNGVSFTKHTDESPAEMVSGKVEFREKLLKAGTMMPMPDISDKMPRRSFFPKAIVEELQFSSSKFSELKEVFHVRDDSSMASILADALSECEREPSPGETTRCVGSAEEMIDFATSVLGQNIVVRTTNNTHGSKQNILIGSVKGINNDKVTKSASCHQSLFPYLLYFVTQFQKFGFTKQIYWIKQQRLRSLMVLAICHVDTSAWSPTHGAFIALGSSPGKIEVCHWIFENDMTWTIADWVQTSNKNK